MEVSSPESIGHSQRAGAALLGSPGLTQAAVDAFPAHPGFGWPHPCSPCQAREAHIPPVRLRERRHVICCTLSCGGGAHPHCVSVRLTTLLEEDNY